jgi:hypothetical protein
MHMTNTHLKRCSTSYVIRKLLVKTRCDYTLVRWQNSKIPTKPNSGEDR